MSKIDKQIALKQPAAQKIDIQNIDKKVPLNDIEFFLNFCGSDIQSAVQELEKIKTEANRKHLQKLVYVNLVNRFDYLVDKLLLWLATNNDPLRNEILESVEEETISRKEVFEIFFMKNNAYDLIIEKIKDLARGSLLRERHSDKLFKILSKCLEWKSIEKPRVSNDGKIFAKATKNKTQPNDIVGYADWLYSRRNSLVHGDGKKYNQKDREHMVLRYQVNLPDNFRLQLASIKSATTFYESLLKEIGKSLFG